MICSYIQFSLRFNRKNMLNFSKMAFYIMVIVRSGAGQIPTVYCSWTFFYVYVLKKVWGQSYVCKNWLSDKCYNIFFKKITFNEIKILKNVTLSYNIFFFTMRSNLYRTNLVTLVQSFK